jgi:S-layer protein (TIGR01564 family)
MAMSLKKIGAIAAGGVMVASALASGAMAAATTSGDVSGFMKNVVKDGTPNVDIVVGSNAAAMDVVSAADIAAKIGSMCYKTGTVTDGSADVTIHAESKSDDFDLKKDWNDTVPAMPADASAMFVAASDGDYSANFKNASGAPDFVDSSVLNDISSINKTVDLGDVSTMMKIDDIDPSDWFSSDDDAGEIVMLDLKNDTDDGFTVYKKDMMYASLAYQDDEDDFANTTVLHEGERIPFLGQEDAVVKIDDDDDAIYLGKPTFDGVVKEGDSIDLGDGYTAKVKAVLKTTNSSGADIYKIDVQMLKDGTVVAEKYDTAPLELVYGGKGITIHKAWENVGGDYGYAELLATTDVKKLSLGDEYITDWKAYAVLNDGGKMKLTDDLNPTTDSKLVGVALRYDGDKIDDLDSGDEVDIANYLEFKLDDDDSNNKLKVYYSMDKSIPATLNIGEKVKALNADVTLNGISASSEQVVPVKAPIAKLDTEVSLDNADKNLILVGGPVVNKLTKELQDAGKISIDNSSPARLAVVSGAANGNDVLVVAGGDRDKTREAALDLIENY